MADYGRTDFSSYADALWWGVVRTTSSRVLIIVSDASSEMMQLCLLLFILFARGTVFVAVRSFVCLFANSTSQTFIDAYS